MEVVPSVVILIVLLPLAAWLWWQYRLLRIGDEAKERNPVFAQKIDCVMAIRSDVKRPAVRGYVNQIHGDLIYWFSRHGFRPPEQSEAVCRSLDDLTKLLEKFAATQSKSESYPDYAKLLATGERAISAYAAKIRILSFGPGDIAVDCAVDMKFIDDVDKGYVPRST